MQSICNRFGALLVVVAAMSLNGVTRGQASWYTVLEQAPNPAIVIDATFRQQILNTGFPWRIQDIGTGIEMLLVPPGKFFMGASTDDIDAYLDESPQHQVTISKAFYLGRTEVTQAQWQAKMASNPSYFKNYSDSGSRPVEQVSWNDVALFNTITDLRLPTEAEWEFACRSGSTTSQYGALPDIAWYSLNAGYKSHPVATKLANSFGFYDMLGNVWEWCQDWKGIYLAGDQTDPSGNSTGHDRVLRGGTFADASSGCRASTRLGNIPEGKGINWGYGRFGFRVARTPEIICPSDLDESGEVDSSDLGNLLLDFGICSQPFCLADFDKSGEVDSSDLGNLLLDFGLCP